MINEALTAIREILRATPGIDRVYDQIPPQIADTKAIIVYPQPGTSTASQHTGQGGNPVIAMRDLFIIEYHHAIAEDDVGSAIDGAVATLAFCRIAIWSACIRKGALASLLIAANSVDTITFGEMGWDETYTFGWRVAVDLTLAVELP